MYKSTITIEVEGENEDSVVPVTREVFKTLLSINTKGVQCCNLSVQYEKDGEYADRDECDMIYEIESRKGDK